MARFLTINLEGLTPPDIIETLSYEDILTEIKDDMEERMDDLGLTFDVKDLESDPAVKILEVAADRETRLRARVNGAAKALLLALAQKNDLVHLGAIFGTYRDETTTPVETDSRLRTRIQKAPQAFSTAGPPGAYEYHVMTVAPTVKHVAVLKTSPGHIGIYPLVNTGDGTPSETVLDAIRLKLLEPDVRPLTDVVNVARPTIYKTDVDVTLMIPEGPDASALTANAKTAIQTYADSRHKVGLALRLSGIYDAAQVSGVDNVIINEPTTDLDPGDHGVVYVPSIKVASRELT